jgi:hypothetical protein
MALNRIRATLFNVHTLGIRSMSSGYQPAPSQRPNPPGSEAFLSCVAFRWLYGEAKREWLFTNLYVGRSPI